MELGNLAVLVYIYLVLPLIFNQSIYQSNLRQLLASVALGNFFCNLCYNTIPTQVANLLLAELCSTFCNDCQHCCSHCTVWHRLLQFAAQYYARHTCNLRFSSITVKRVVASCRDCCKLQKSVPPLAKKFCNPLTYYCDASYRGLFFRVILATREGES